MLFQCLRTVFLRAAAVILQRLGVESVRLQQNCVRAGIVDRELQVEKQAEHLQLFAGCAEHSVPGVQLCNSRTADCEHAIFKIAGVSALQ